MHRILLIWTWILYIFLLCSTVWTSKCSNPLVHFGTQGNIVSHPEYGRLKYQPDTFCEYEIRAPVDYEISITIMELDIEDSNNCIFDYLAIGSKSNPDLYVFCGQAKPDYSVQIRSNQALVTFATDSGNQGHGFKLRFDAQPKWNSSIESCGIAPPSNSKARIMGGSMASPGQWPWMVSLKYNERFTCAGTLINLQWIVTAAHCFAGKRNISNWKATIGDAFLNWADAEEQTLNITTILIHPEYGKRHTYDFDLALLRLKDSIKQNRYAQPICLPTAPGIQEFYNCHIAGWGRSETQSISKELRYAALPIIDLDMCNQTEAYKGMITDSMLCAGYMDGSKDACKGDSGGPLMCQQKMGSQIWYQTGVVSFGKYCAKAGTPGIYHRISVSLDWIKNKTRMS